MASVLVKIQSEKQMNLSREKEQAFKAALMYLQEAMAAEKCRACGCFHSLLQALEKAFPERKGPEELMHLTEAAKQCLVPQRYDCLGCEVCIPPLVLNALGQTLGDAVSDLEVCPSEPVTERQGWPPLPGDYRGAALPGASGRLHSHLRGPGGRSSGGGRAGNRPGGDAAH